MCFHLARLVSLSGVLASVTTFAGAADRIAKPMAVAIPDEMLGAFSFTGDALEVWESSVVDRRLRIANVRTGSVRTVPMPIVWPPGVPRFPSSPNSPPPYVPVATSAANGLVLLRLQGIATRLTDVKPYCVWKVDDGSLLALDIEPTSKYTNGVFSADGRTLAMWGEKLTFEARIPRQITGRERRDPILAKREPLIKVWRMPAARPVQELLGHEMDIGSASLSPDGSRLISTGSIQKDSKLKRLELYVWDLRRGTLEAELYGKDKEPARYGGGLRFNPRWMTGGMTFVGGSRVAIFDCARTMEARICNWSSGRSIRKSDCFGRP